MRQSSLGERVYRRTLPAVGLCLAAGIPAAAQTLAGVQVAEVYQAIYAAAPPADFTRLFVASKAGDVRVIMLPNHTLLPTPFVTVPQVNNVGEQGLLGLAFHPNYESNGYCYVTYNRSTDGNMIVARYTRSAADPNVADPNSALMILRIERGEGVHNGGWTAFGPDGYLYVSTGDLSNPPLAQGLTQLHGKILRIDVDGDDFPASTELNYRIPAGNPFPLGGANRPEIWAWGLRNPWRCGIDRATGDLYVTDVGQQLWEEVSFQPAGLGGLNYGWPCMEGLAPWNSTPGCTDPLTRRDPFLVYGHNSPVPPTNHVGCAITGGDVYRGCAIPGLAGTYFFADFCTARFYSLRYNGSVVTDVVNRTAQLQPSGGSILAPVGFGTDALGEIYICDISGVVYKIVPAAPQGPDCNENGVNDACDIASRASDDDNLNGVPDECESNGEGDVDGDRDVDIVDLARLLVSYGSCAGSPQFDSGADFNATSCVDLGDLAILLQNFGRQP